MIPSTSRPRCCWKARTARSSSSSNTSSTTCFPVVRSASGLSTKPRAASAARISMTAPLRSPRRRAYSSAPRCPLDMPRALRSSFVTAEPTADDCQQVSQHCLRWRTILTRTPPDRLTDVGNDVGHLPQQGGLALGAHDPLDRLTVLEQYQRRNGNHAEVTRGLRVGVHVEFGDRELPGA